MEIQAKIIKQGNGYGMRIPKALIDCKILENGKTYIIKEIEELQRAVSLNVVRVPISMGCC